MIHALMVRLVRLDALRELWLDGNPLEEVG